MKLFEKLLCGHKWQSHAKEVYKWEEIEIVPGTETWLRPNAQNKPYQETVEILICVHCGKIQKIKY